MTLFTEHTNLEMINKKKRFGKLSTLIPEDRRRGGNSFQAINAHTTEVEHKTFLKWIHFYLKSQLFSITNFQLQKKIVTTNRGRLVEKKIIKKSQNAVQKYKYNNFQNIQLLYILGDCTLNVLLYFTF